jgi:hypothetical protein
MTAHASRFTMKDSGIDSSRPAGKAAKDSREGRLKLALRENLKRRKSQARGRADFMPASPDSDDVSHDGDEENPG